MLDLGPNVGPNLIWSEVSRDWLTIGMSVEAPFDLLHLRTATSQPTGGEAGAAVMWDSVKRGPQEGDRDDNVHLSRHGRDERPWRGHCDPARRTRRAGTGRSTHQ
jgi:hypothetical protein